MVLLNIFLQVPLCPHLLAHSMAKALMKDHPKTQHKNCLERDVIFGPVYLNQNRKSRVEDNISLQTAKALMKDHPKTQHKNCLERDVIFGPVYLNQNRKSRVENKFVLKEEWRLLNMIFPQVPLCPNLMHTARPRL